MIPERKDRKACKDLPALRGRKERLVPSAPQGLRGTLDLRVLKARSVRKGRREILVPLVRKAP